MCIPFSHDTLSLVDVQAFENIMAFILDPAVLHVEIVGLIFEVGVGCPLHLLTYM